MRWDEASSSAAFSVIREPSGEEAPSGWPRRSSRPSGGDPVALLAVLDSAMDTPREALGRIEVPALVAAGAEDIDNGSAAALADALVHGRYAELPGNHMSAVAKPELGTAIADFLSGT